MYGTVARIRVKPGMEQALIAELDAHAAQVPGYREGHLYRLDKDPSAYLLTIVFDSKEAYVANAQSPEQNARYQRLRAAMAEDPEWMDGEIVGSYRR
jgi:heme-degrading monooxygenase HmoA